MSRIDDRIRARLHMQIVLRGIASLMICAGLAVCVLWLIGPFVEMILRGHGYTGTVNGRLKANNAVLTLGLSIVAPGILLLFATEWLSERWMPLRHHGMCPECDYPLDDAVAKSCPECGHGLHRERSAPRTSSSDPCRTEA